jgi:hypothetical protein
MSSLQPDDREHSDIIGEAEEAHKRLTEELASMNPEELPYPTWRITTERKIAKLEEGLRMANNTGMFQAFNVTDIKEAVTGTLLHRQCDGSQEHIHAKAKLTADGRLIYRMLQTQLSSSQTAYTLKLLNSGLKVNSVTNTFNMGAHNGKDSIENMGPALEQINAWIKELKDEPLVIEDEVLLPNRSGDGQIRASKITVYFDIVLCLDRATQFSLCPEACGPGAKKPCNRCGVVKDHHAGCENIGMLCEVVTTKQNACLTVNKVAALFEMTPQHVRMVNSPKGVRGASKESKQESKALESALQGLSISRALGADQTIPDTTKPFDLSSFGDDEPIPDDVNIRVRLLWVQDRALAPELSSLSWAEILLCSLHCRLRTTEALVDCLQRWSVSGSKVNEFNAMMRAENIRYTLTMKDGSAVRPKLQGYQTRDFMKASQTDPNKKRYQVVIEALEDAEYHAATLRVWKTYENLMGLVDMQYPSPRQQGMIAAYTFEHMLAFRLRYGSEDVTHYLHTLFAHATSMMRKFKSIGLYKNESDECLHSEDKKFTEDHTHRGGCGIPLLKELMAFWRRKLYRACRGSRRLVSAAITTTPAMTWTQYKAHMRGS